MRIKINTRIVIVVMAVVVGLVGVLPFVSLPVEAVTQSDLDRIKDELGKIKGRISAYEQEAQSLRAQANTLSNQISILRNEENILTAEIALYQTEYDRLVADIVLKEERIADNSEMMGYIVAQFYYNEDISMVERLASSENLSSFIDEEARLSNFTDTLSGIVKETKALKAELEVKRDEAKVAMANLEIKKDALEEKRKEQQRLLNETQGMESTYQQMTQEAKAERIRLEAEQRAVELELCRIYGCQNSMGDGTKGGYASYIARTWPGAVCPRDNNKYNNSFGNSCQCVSYAAWRVYQAYGISLNIPGNANNWDNWANGRYIVSKTPKPGSVGMHNKGSYGHVVWVEAVSGEKVFVSEFNGSGIAGDYNEKWTSQYAYEWYIYFGG